MLAGGTYFRPVRGWCSIAGCGPMVACAHGADPVCCWSASRCSSGIPSYEQQPAFLADYVADPYANDTTERLVSYAAQAPATSGYSYSNTNYILAQMIIEKASEDTYDHQLYNRIIDPLGLHELTFSRHVYPATITAREPAGYFYLKEIPVLLGHDVSRHSLSFAQGAGGIVGTTREMTRWERALYSGRVLPATQQAELLSLVSTKTGQPIGKTSQADTAGYGLGVQQGTTQKSAPSGPTRAARSGFARCTCTWRNPG